MKCINCKKEIADVSKYCVYCGEKLTDNVTSDAQYNYNVDNSNQYKNISTNMRKHKIPVIIGSVVVLIAIFGVCVFNYLQGQPVDKNELKDYIIGKNISIDGENHIIKKGELKSFIVTSRKSVKKQSDYIKSSVTLNLVTAKVVADVDYTLYYNKEKNKWEFSQISYFDTKNVTPKVELKDKIKDLIKAAKIQYDWNSIDLSKDLLKNVSNIKVTGKGADRNVTANLTLSNGVVEATVSTNFTARFDLEKGKWVLDSNYLSSKIVDKEKVATNVSDDNKKKFVLTAFANAETYPYKYKSRDYDRTEYISLVKDNISDLKINNFMEYDGKIRAEISGQASSGDINKINFSGVVNLDLSLTESSYSDNSVNIDSLEIANANLDNIKKDMLKFELDDKTITVAVANTFNLGAETSNSDMFDKEYEGTITIDGASKKVRNRINLEYNDDDKKYEWTLNDIDLMDN